MSRHAATHSELLDQHLGVVHQHIGGALRNLIGISENIGYGLDVLDGWFEARRLDAMEHGQSEDLSEPQQIEAPVIEAEPVPDEPRPERGPERGAERGAKRGAKHHAVRPRPKRGASARTGTSGRHSARNAWKAPHSYTMGQPIVLPLSLGLAFARERGSTVALLGRR